MKEMMSKYSIRTIVLGLIICSVILSSCISNLQTYSKHDLSFTVPSGLELIEYQFDPSTRIYQIGEANSEAGIVLTSEGHFVFQWLRTVQKLSDENISAAIMSAPDIYESGAVDIEVAFTSDLKTDVIAGFDVTYVEMQFTSPDRKTIGITALWYCPDSQRTVMVTFVHNKPEKEMNRFIRSFADNTRDQ